MERCSYLKQINEINENLYISGFGPVTDHAIKNLGITCVIDATNIPNRPRKDVEFVKVSVDDSEFSKLDAHFDSVADKIHEHAQKGGKTLVHCAAGISRSAALCLVYLVKYTNVSLKEAYLSIREKRPMICPNNGFWRQMIEFEKKLTKNSTVKMIRGRYYREVPDVYFAEREQKRTETT